MDKVDLLFAKGWFASFFLAGIFLLLELDFSMIFSTLFLD